MPSGVERLEQRVDGDLGDRPRVEVGLGGAVAAAEPGLVGQHDAEPLGQRGQVLVVVAHARCARSAAVQHHQHGSVADLGHGDVAEGGARRSRGRASMVRVVVVTDAFRSRCGWNVVRRRWRCSWTAGRSGRGGSLGARPASRRPAAAQDVGAAAGEDVLLAFETVAVDQERGSHDAGRRAVKPVVLLGVDVVARRRWSPGAGFVTAGPRPRPCPESNRRMRHARLSLVSS